jgi:hypothetical protein
MKLLAGLIWLKWEGSYELGTELSASINGRSFLTQLSNY